MGVCVFIKDDKTSNFEDYRSEMPISGVKHRLSGQHDDPLNPKTVLTSLEHEIHPFRMFWGVLEIPCDLP